MKLDDIRAGIDLLDIRIMKLLKERMEQGLLAGRLKTEVEDDAREGQVLESVRRQATLLTDEDFLKRIYGDIIGESKNLQRREFKLIGFQGDHGAYGEAAAKEWNPELVQIPCRAPQGVFEGVEAGIFDYGIVPVENSLGGVVGTVNELLVDTMLHVVGAIELPVHHCLLVLPGTDHREIRTVYSHPQALTQCRSFLGRNKLEPAPFSDTAAAAKMLNESRPAASAAIASRLAADLYNLEILKENIEDLNTNATRFLVLAREENTAVGDKCSIVFRTAHKARALFRVLEVFANHDINLTRIESIPDEPGTYAFFLDFAGAAQEDHVRKALEEATASARSLRLLGCYTEKRVP